MNYKEVIESRYNRQSWQLLLHDIFGSKIKFWNHPSSVQTSSPFAKQAFWLGTITLSDGQTIAIYEVELADNVDIERNRRGIRDMLLTTWRNNGNAGAFMFCYRKSESVLRFSYVSEAWKFAEDGSYQKETTDARRFTYLLGEGHRSRTAIQQFERLRDSGLSLKDLTKAFSVDAVSDMFFDGYKKQYENIIFYITGKRMVKVGSKWEERLEGKPCQHIMQQFSRFPNPEKAIRDYVKKLMGRLVFLQFLQKKGWLGVGIHDEWGSGDPEFIQNLFKDCPDKDHFVNKVLNLLFNDLNTERKDDLSKLSTLNSQLIKIPYLNGGLFEREAADEMEFPLPAKYMQSLLDFFASYNFTIDENDPDDAEVGVDPEMLGRIFENLLEDNKDKGAFYTPKEIVSYMCRESLIAYLQTGIEDEMTKEAIRQFVTTHQVQEHLPENTDQLLKDVKICDPAIGSGAFPMGLLKELFLCRTALEGISQHQAVEIKKHIIQQNVYGVDIERGAVDIARLRFWLSLIVDEETPQALPNLDFKIMQGNSLIESYGGFDLSRIAGKTVGRPSTSTQYVIGLDSDLSQKNLQRLLREYFSVTDHQKKATMRHAINAEVKTLIRESVGGIPTFLAKLEQLDPSANQDFFLWHTWFKDIIDKGGFDIVIGNPPYFQVKKGMVNKNKYPYSEGKDKGKQNVYKLFVEHSYNILSTNGVCTLITQSSLMCDSSSQYTRELLLKKTTISQVIEFPKVAPHPGGQLFKGALVATCIVIYRKTTPTKEHVFYLSAHNDLTTLENFDFAQLSQQTPIDFYPEGYCFPLIRRQDFSIIEKMNNGTMFLGKMIQSSSQGDFNLTNESFCFSTKPTDVKMYRGCHVHRYYIDNEVEEFILGGYKNDIVQNNIKNRYIVCQQISGMTDKRRFNVAITKQDKCLFGNSVNKLAICREHNPFYILAIINSQVIDWYFRKTSTNNHVNIYELEQLPIPEASQEQQKPIVELINRIMEKKQSNSSADISLLEREIDRLVYKLYNLTDEEIGVIEQ